jgi:hypothetical protein
MEMDDRMTALTSCVTSWLLANNKYDMQTNRAISKKSVLNSRKACKIRERSAYREKYSRHLVLVGSQSLPRSRDFFNSNNQLCCHTPNLAAFTNNPCNSRAFNCSLLPGDLLLRFQSPLLLWLPRPPRVSSPGLSLALNLSPSKC